MKRSRLGVLLRVAAAVAMTSGWLSWSVRAEASHHIDFTSCSSGSSPSPTVTPSPGPASPTPSSEGPPPQNCTPVEGSVIRGTHLIRFTVTADPVSQIREVIAFLDSETTGVSDIGAVQLNCPTPDEDPNTDGCQSQNTPISSGVYTFRWDSNDMTPENAAYTLRVEARAEPHVPPDQAWATATRKHLIVDNPPAALPAPKVLAATQTTVTVEWQKALEPDVQSYTLYRAFTVDRRHRPTDQAFKPDVLTTLEAVRDNVGRPGAYWYRVQVTRRSAVTPAAGISSPISETSGPGVVAGLEATPLPSGTVPYRPPALIPQIVSAPPPVPDAPFSALLPYKTPDIREAGPSAPEQGASTADPRGTVLPVAVGAFLVSSALALGRMPF